MNDCVNLEFVFSFLEECYFHATILYTLNRLSINMLIALMNFFWGGNDCQ